MAHRAQARERLQTSHLRTTSSRSALPVRSIAIASLSGTRKDSCHLRVAPKGNGASGGRSKFGRRVTAGRGESKFGLPGRHAGSPAVAARPCEPASPRPASASIRPQARVGRHARAHMATHGDRRSHGQRWVTPAAGVRARRAHMATGGDVENGIT
eukprot:scaffold29501_cov100-Isochrysis_galbana.AAC.2